MKIKDDDERIQERIQEFVEDIQAAVIQAGSPRKLYRKRILLRMNMEQFLKNIMTSSIVLSVHHDESLEAKEVRDSDVPNPDIKPPLTESYLDTSA